MSIHAAAVDTHSAGQSIHGIAIALAIGHVVVELELLLLRDGLLRDDFGEALEAGCLQP